MTDGVYRLEILPTTHDLAGNPLDGDGDGIGGDAYRIQGDAESRFFVLRGDWNGDAGVAIADFSALAYWFGQPSSAAPSYVDLNHDGGISIFDFAGYASNFARFVSFPEQPAGLIAVPLAPVSPSSNARSDDVVGRHPAPTTPTGDQVGVHDASLWQILAGWSGRERVGRDRGVTWPN